MTTELPDDVWTPVPLRWRHAQVGDVFVGQGARLWQVAEIRPELANLRVEAHQGHTHHSVLVDLDDVIDVLIPVPEREAVELAREVLGARLVERRTSSPKDD